MENPPPRPEFFALGHVTDSAKFDQLRQTMPHLAVIDTYEQQLLELFVLNHPWLQMDPGAKEKEFRAYRDNHYGQNEPQQAGVWVYLPWRQTVLHLLADDDYQVVRTGRNRNLINAEEQKKFYDSTVGIAGLSVGNSCAVALALTGGCKRMRLADPDVLELTNLNRIRGSIADLTKLKVHMTAQQIYELDPYADLTLFSDGLTEENIEQFFDGPPRLDVVIDEMDSLGLKVRIREEAQKRRTPVIMGADVNNGSVLDIERHDLEEGIVPFHGRAGTAIADRVVGKKLPLPLIGQIITEEIIGADLISARMQESLLEIGKSIPTWPQLGNAALINGAVIAMAVRHIILGQPLIADRAVIAPESSLIPGYTDESEINRRQMQTNAFLETYQQLIQTILGPKP